MAGAFLKFKLDGQKKLARKFNLWNKNLKSVYQKNIKIHTLMLQKVSRLTLKKNKTDNLRELSAAIKIGFEDDFMIGFIDVPDPDEKGQTNYGVYVEFGTSPHFPPIEPLAFWAKNKFSLSEKEAKQVGFLVARKISENNFIFKSQS